MQHRTPDDEIPPNRRDRVPPGPLVELPQHVVRRGRRAAAAIDTVRPEIEKLRLAGDPQLRAAAYFFERGIKILELIEHRGLTAAIARIRHAV